MFCFVIIMVSVQSNNVNVHMKLPDLKVGVLTPPDSHYKPVLYSDREASAKFQEMNADIYLKQKKLDFEDTKKTPKSVKALGIAGVLTMLAFGVKKLLKK